MSTSLVLFEGRSFLIVCYPVKRITLLILKTSSNRLRSILFMVLSYYTKVGIIVTVKVCGRDPVSKTYVIYELSHDGKVGFLESHCLFTHVVRSRETKLRSDFMRSLFGTLHL